MINNTMGVRETSKISKTDKSKIYLKMQHTKNMQVFSYGKYQLFFWSAHINIRSGWLRAFGGKSAIYRRRVVIEFTNIYTLCTTSNPPHGHSARISPTLPQGHSASKCPKSRSIITSPTSKHISHPANSFWHS